MPNFFLRAAFLLPFFWVLPAFAQNETPVAPTLTPAPTLALGAHVRELASGFQFCEGPVWNPRGFWLFSDIPADTLWKITPGGKTEIVRQPSGHSNGNAYDAQDRLISCEHGNRRVARKTPDGTFETLVDTFEGKRLNSPNDLAIRRDGSIYFTDPTYGLTNQRSELGFRGLFRLAPSGILELLDKNFQQPNGIALSPDQTKLYVGDSQSGQIWMYDVNASGQLLNRTLIDTIAKPGDPDGLKTDSDGNLYIAAPDGIRVYARLGGFLGLIPVPKPPANLAFGGEDGKTLLITARDSIYCVEMNVGALSKVVSPGK